MNPKVIETINLYKEGSSDKFYVASIQEQNGKYSVPVTWGRQGTSGQSEYKVENTSLEEAQKAYNKVVKEKTGKGYKVSSEHTSCIPTKIVGLPTITVKRKIDWKEQTLLPQLLNEIEENEIEKYINNPEYCAQEKYDGRRRLLRYQSGKTEGLNKKGQTTGYPETLHLTCKEIEKLNGWYETLKNTKKEGIVFKLLNGTHKAGYSPTTKRNSSSMPQRKRYSPRR
jgi:predicted DNA-binding WGR domain protein